MKAKGKQESRKKKSIRNITYNLVNQSIALILAFLSRTVFIWGFGVEYLGLNSLFTDVLSLLSMADLGFGTAMVFSFYKPLAENNQKKMAALICFYRKIYNVIAFSVTAIGLCIIPALPFIVNVQQPIPNMYIYYVLSLLNVSVSYLCVYKTSILTADQNAYIIAQVNMFCNIFKTVVQCFSIILWKNYLMYLGIGIVFTISANIIASVIAKRKYPFITQEEKLSNEDRADIFKNIGSMVVFKVSSVMITNVDNILISTIISTAMVGFYSNYLLIQNKIIQMSALIFTSVTASIGNVIATESVSKRYNIFKIEQKFSFVLSGIIVPCYIVLVNDFIRLWLGDKYLLQNSVVFIIGLNMYLSCVLQPLWSYREATGMFRKTKWAMLACAVLNVVLSIALGFYIGLAGILVASCISRLLTYVWYEPIVLFRDYFNRKATGFIAQLVGNIFVIAGITSILRVVMSRLTVESYMGWSMKAAISVGLSTILSVAVYVRRNELLEIVKFVKQKIK